MRIPISSLFFKFDKFRLRGNDIDLAKCPNLEFHSIDIDRFPAIRLGYQVMKMGGLAPHIFNYLNEILVKLFVKKKIKFIEIVKFNEINLDIIFKILILLIQK